MAKYRIIRMYRHKRPKATGVVYDTLEEAQEHCRREDTRKEGKWFDGYEET